jgi:Holliday junction resolvasome RuvABC endonuclease subunit
MPRRAWFEAHEKLPFESVARLESWQEAMADGVIEIEEVEQQKERLLGLLRELEPLLDDATHERVTRVLEEWTVLTAMQTTLLVDDLGGPR